MNFTDPDMQESKIRRTNRLVYIFLYAMIDLLNYIQGKRDIIEAVYGDPPPFLSKEISDWSFEDIFEYGPVLFNYIMMNRSELGPLINDYYDRYDISIKVVTDLLNDRIAHAQVTQIRIPTIQTLRTIIEEMPPIREATFAQQEAMRSTVNSIYLLEGMNEEVIERIRHLGYGDLLPQSSALEPETDADADDGTGFAAPQIGEVAWSKKKRTRRRRKSKGNNSTKGKKKKGRA